MSDVITQNFVCPHCGGVLTKTRSILSWQYDCLRCSRGWRIDDAGTWHACFDAGNDTYDIERFNEAQGFRNHKSHLDYSLEMWQSLVKEKSGESGTE